MLVSVQVIPDVRDLLYFWSVAGCEHAVAAVGDVPGVRRHLVEHAHERVEPRLLERLAIHAFLPFPEKEKSLVHKAKRFGDGLLVENESRHTFRDDLFPADDDARPIWKNRLAACEPFFIVYASVEHPRLQRCALGEYLYAAES